MHTHLGADLTKNNGTFLRKYIKVSAEKKKITPLFKKISYFWSFSLCCYSLFIGFGCYWPSFCMLCLDQKKKAPILPDKVACIKKPPIGWVDRPGLYWHINFLCASPRTQIVLHVLISMGERWQLKWLRSVIQKCRLQQTQFYICWCLSCTLWPMVW